MKRMKSRRIRLQTKIFGVFSILLVLCLVAASTVIINISEDLYMEEIAKTSALDLALSTSSLDSVLQRISNTAVSITADSRVIAAVRRYPDAPHTEAEKSRLRSTLGLNIGTLIGASTDVFMWDIFSLSGTPFGLSAYDISRIFNQIDDDFFQSAASQPRTRLSGIYYYTTPYSYSIKWSTPVFLVCKPIMDLDTLEPLGFLLMVIRENRISRVFSRNPAVSDVSFMVVNEDNRIVSSLDKDHLGLTPEEIFPLTPEQYQQLLDTGKYISDSCYYAISQPLSGGYASWRVLSINPLHSVIENRQKTISTVVFFCATICLVLFFASYLVSRTLTRPIDNLSHSIHTAAAMGKVQPLPDPGGGYEIGILYTSFNGLLERIRQLIDHINQEQEEKSNYKFQLVQAQVKPHFLYNTLMTIKALIDLDMNETASECVYAMSSFYRLSLNKGNDILRLSDEVELSQQYMYIQKLRYFDQLDYRFDIPKSLYNCLLPKMTIQPILENAIYHGVKKKGGKGVIEVIGQDLEDRMVFTITDNGCGMNGQDLARLRASLNANDGDMTPRNASFGLYSVHHRIRLIYGDAYGVYIDSRPGEYTTVTLILPKRTTYGGES